VPGVSRAVESIREDAATRIAGRKQVAGRLLLLYARELEHEHAHGGDLLPLGR